MSGDARTLAAYDDQARRYCDLVDGDEPLMLRAFIKALPEGARVLDLGAGPGQDAAKMAAAGLMVTAMDGSPAMVAIAAAQPGVEAVQASFDSLDAIARYDGIWASFSLLHAARTDLPRHLAAVHKALKQNGLFVIAMKLVSGERRDSFGRLYSYYGKIELADLLENAGFAITATETDSSVGLEGNDDPYLVISARA